MSRFLLTIQIQLSQLETSGLTLNHHGLPFCYQDITTTLITWTIETHDFEHGRVCFKKFGAEKKLTLFDKLKNMQASRQDNVCKHSWPVIYWMSHLVPTCINTLFDFTWVAERRMTLGTISFVQWSEVMVISSQRYRLRYRSATVCIRLISSTFMSKGSNYTQRSFDGISDESILLKWSLIGQYWFCWKLKVLLIKLNAFWLISD